MLERVLARASSPVAAILDKALVIGGHAITVQDGTQLLSARGQNLKAVAAAADFMRQQRVGDTVTYAVNRNINYTNACTLRCGFCAFSRTGECQRLCSTGVVQISYR